MRQVSDDRGDDNWHREPLETEVAGNGGQENNNMASARQGPGQRPTAKGRFTIALDTAIESQICRPCPAFEFRVVRTSQRNSGLQDRRVLVSREGFDV